MLPIEWRPSALGDLAEIMQYISARNAAAAQRLFERIEASIEHTSEHPYLYKQSDRVQGAREIVVYPNYIILYRVMPHCIEVTNVVHAMRNYPPSH
jgi:toxin ParE1/3/4